MDRLEKEEGARNFIERKVWEETLGEIERRKRVNMIIAFQILEGRKVKK